jgi:carboxylesterase type B
MTNITICEVCDKELPLVKIETFGRSLWVCAECHTKEVAAQENLSKTDYKDSLTQRIETVVAKSVDKTPLRFEQIYNDERKAWVVSNFESIQDMREKLTAYLIELEDLEFTRKSKIRAAYDGARELDAKLSKAERDLLINDPNFKVPENKQFKKLKTERQSKEDKAIAALMVLGLSEAEARKQMGQT